MASTNQNFRSMSIMPMAQELLNKTLEYSDPRGAYDTAENYLRSKFLSTRERFSKTLSEAIEKYVNPKPTKKKSDSYRKLPIYENVRIEGFEVNDDSFGIKLFFEDSEKWQELRPSLLGKIVVLTRDNFQTVYFATVTNCSPKYLRKGCIFVEPLWRTDLRSNLNGFRYVLLETHKPYKSYHQELKALQSRKDSDFPMVQYIIKNGVCTELPLYLKNSPEVLENLQQLTIDNQLDESQWDALKHAVTHEFTVIKGPPGTGKTLLASKIVRTLLNNEKSWNKLGSILIICATDTALDQILKSALQYTTSVVRVGNQTEDEFLKPYSLMVKREQMNSQGKRYCALLYKKKCEVEEILRCIQKLKLYAKFFTASIDAVFQNCIADLSTNKLKSSEEFIRGLSEKCFKSLFEDVNSNTAQDNSNSSVNLLKYFEKDRKSLRDDDLPINYNKSGEPDLGLYIDPINLKELELLNTSCTLYQQKLFNNTILNDQSLPHHRTTKSNYWESIQSCHYTLVNSLYELEKKYYEEKSLLENIKHLANLEVFREHKVIGITYDYTGTMTHSLNSLESPILLVDEAEKISETQIVCSMAKNCQHLILMGDTVMPKLKSTLFERMVNVEENCVSLKYQHRMRSEITELISLCTDNVFHSHTSVKNYPSLKGMGSNLFFFNHDHLQTNDGVNKFDIEFLIALAKYLMRVGYKASDITILSTCCRQANAFMTEIRNEETLKEVQISTIFDYLGKENKIIFVSMVNNSDCKVEYLKSVKALLPAFSRAREGLFITSTLRNFSKNCVTLTIIKQFFEKKQTFGNRLKLMCQNHPNESFSAVTPEDIKKFTDGCSKMCKWFLPCGHICTKVCHTTNREHENVVCTQKCDKTLPCNHPCPMTCVHYCQPCQVKVERTLKCGHTVEVPCSDDPDSFPCPVEVHTFFPECNHIVEKPCHIPIENYECTHDCEIRLSCGHSCSGKCHAKSDPNHIEYKCVKDCAKKNKGCVYDHRCEMLCHEECGYCTVIVNKPRSCGHVFYNIQCSENIDKINCDTICNRTLKCGHKCLLKCDLNCTSYHCRIKVNKKSPCGHFEVEVACYQEVTSSSCDKRCPKKLPCGHACVERCRDPCTNKCEFMVRLSRPGDCGHVFSVPCYLQDLAPSTREALNYCEEPCTAVLSCGHDCPGTCESCKNGSVHKLCEVPCSTILPCGHKCEIPCDKQCHPCLKPCQLKCRHSKCNNRCGEPCFPCLEPCGLGCEHKRCNKRCSDLCEIEPCNKPCMKVLRCNHLCVGYCGEPCPPICRTCDYDQLKRKYPDLVDNVNTRFVLLPDCGHCIESMTLSRHIEESAANKKIQFKHCPECQYPIMNCTRLMNSIKRDLKDLNIIKRSMFYNNAEEDVKTNQKKYFTSIITMKTNPDFRDNSDLQDYLLILGKEKKKNLSFYEVDVLRILSEILCQISNTLKVAIMNNDYQNSIRSKVSELVKLLPPNLQISTQRLLDIQSELRRLRLLVEASKHPFYNTTNGSNVNGKNVMLDILHTYGKFTDEADSEIVQLLNAPKNLFDKNVIVKEAIFKMVQWYKCPAGHYYNSEMNENETCGLCT